MRFLTVSVDLQFRAVTCLIPRATGLLFSFALRKVKGRLPLHKLLLSVGNLFKKTETNIDTRANLIDF